MDMGRLIWCITLAIMATTSMAQVDDSEPLMESSTAIRLLNALEVESINLNTSTFDELRKLPGITTQEVDAILSHRNTYGPFVSALELQVCGFPRTRIESLRPYLHISEQFEFMGALPKYDHQLHVTYSVTRDSSLWRGASKTVRMRSRLSNQLRLGLAIDADPLEPIHDFLTGFMAYNKGRLRLIVGDYRIAAGQSLTFGYAGMNRKSMLIHSAYYPADGLRPYTSIQEAEHLRGVAVQRTGRRTTGIIWVDQKALDATTTNNLVAHIARSGLHQTRTEKRRKHAVKHQTAGLHVHHQHKQLKLGLTVVSMRLRNVKPGNGQIDASFDTPRAGLSYRWRRDKGIWFGEIHLHQHGISHIHGGQVMLTPTVQASVLVRYLHPSKPSYYSSTFAESSSGQNEAGYYTGLTWEATRRLQFGAYLDQYKKIRLVNPSQWYNGSEALFWLRYRHSRRLQAYLRYKTETRLYQQVEYLHQFRFHLQDKISRNLESRIRIEWNLDQRRQQGSMAYHEFNWQLLPGKLKLRMRHTLAHIEHYDNRIYMYSFNTPLTYTVPAISRSGFYWLGQILWKFNRHWQIWVRFAANKYVVPIDRSRNETPGASQLRLHIKTSW